MFVTYKSKSIEKLCTDEREMRRHRGDIAKKLKLRINALETCDSVGSLVRDDPLGNWHALSGDRKGQWAGKVSANDRLIIVPQGASEVVVGMVLSATEVEVQGVEDYHRR